MNYITRVVVTAGSVGIENAILRYVVMGITHHLAENLKIILKALRPKVI